MDRDLVEQAQRGDREAFAILARTRGDRLFGDRATDPPRRRPGRGCGAAGAGDRLARAAPPPRSGPVRRLAPAPRSSTPATRRRAASGPGSRTSGSCRSTDRRSRTRRCPVADRDELERGFRRLPPEQRAILVLHHYLGLTPTEIAETLGIPAGTARSRLHYAHRAMRAALEADERPVAVAGGHPMTDHATPTAARRLLCRGARRAGRPGDRCRPRRDRPHPTAARVAPAAEVLEDGCTRTRDCRRGRGPRGRGRRRRRALLHERRAGANTHSGSRADARTDPQPTPAPTPAASEVAPGITGWTTYTSEVYGITFGYPDGWTLESAATRQWEGPPIATTSSRTAIRS